MNHTCLWVYLPNRLNSCGWRLALCQPQLKAIVSGVFIGSHPAPFSTTKGEEGDLVDGCEEAAASRFLRSQMGSIGEQFLSLCLWSDRRIAASPV